MAFGLQSCSSGRILTDVRPISGDALKAKKEALTDAQLKVWFMADPVRDSVAGISLERVKESMKPKKRSEVVVAIVDSGVDLNHPGFSGSLWQNLDELPENGIDDDNNGYVDDVNGYNFLGDSYYEQMEYVRMLTRGIGSTADLERAKTIHSKEVVKAQENKSQYKRLYELAKTAIDSIGKALETEAFDLSALEQYTPSTAYLAQQKAVLSQLFTYVDESSGLLKELESGLAYFTERHDYNLNLALNAREVVGDDPYDINDTVYGDGNPAIRNPDESHGTHVAGIVRSIAPFASLMLLRTVPAGDEYDKDVALAIRYAVDNGANIINCSFGKSFSPRAEWVWDAIRYANEKGVLIVHAAGNDGKNLDAPETRNFPDDHKGLEKEFVSNFISVGALTASLDQGLVADFSNYGSANVDLYAPGDQIYSFMPANGYEFQGGTSMASPVVTAVAAWIKAYYPKKSAAEIKQILLDSSIRLPLEVIVPGSQVFEPFQELSKTGGMVNLYNALIRAQQR
jgi:subtilisin family serine protease